MKSIEEIQDNRGKGVLVNKIDEFEATRKSRRAILLINMFGLCFSGLMVPAAFFTGAIQVFMFAILLFSFMVLVNSSCGMSYFLLIGKIRKWKLMTWGGILMSIGRCRKIKTKCRKIIEESESDIINRENTSNIAPKKEDEKKGKIRNKLKLFNND